MADYGALQARVEELAAREWDVPAFEASVNKLVAEGIPAKQLDPAEIVANRQQVLDRVQRRAEEYNLATHNCARGTALALLEEFGLGSIDVVHALSPFPGFGGTGWMCGGVTGGLIALGLYFGSADLLDGEAVGASMAAAREFMARFQEEAGSVLCPSLHEEVVFGRYMDPGASPENMEAFAAAKGFEKCGLLPGIGARIAAELMIDSLAR
ncbi:MAG TPA: C-GCAxxG-C-C family protein [Anaerolineae bacterium]|nr:C-GCAxxG-C-C family protein [Anaerolineae bacterium]